MATLSVDKHGAEGSIGALLGNLYSSSSLGICVSTSIGPAETLPRWRVWLPTATRSGAVTLLGSLGPYFLSTEVFFISDSGAIEANLLPLESEFRNASIDKN